MRLDGCMDGTGTGCMGGTGTGCTDGPGTGCVDGTGAGCVAGTRTGQSGAGAGTDAPGIGMSAAGAWVLLDLRMGAMLGGLEECLGGGI